MTIIECLVIEHRVFSDLLELMDKAVGNPVRYPDTALRAMVEMLAVPLERHARTEEDVLFPALEVYLERSEGPLAVMDAEHERIRLALGAVSAGLDVRGQTTKLIETLRGHIHKEERVLFPMAQEWLGEQTLGSLAPASTGRH